MTSTVNRNADNTQECESIAEIFPITVSSAVYKDFTFICPECGDNVTSSQLTGTITEDQAVTALVAHGECENCGLELNVDIRFHEDLKITGYINKIWHSWSMPSSHQKRMFERIWSIFK